jgi:hypothetical protein
MGHFGRIVFAGLVLAGCIGMPSCTAASSLATSGLGIGSLVKAAFGALVAGAIAAALTRRLVREIWTGWVGVLGGVVPASLVAEPARQRAAAFAYFAGGAVLVGLGWLGLSSGRASGSVLFSFSGLVEILVGAGIALAGAIPRLVFARGRITTALPDDAVTRHVWLFLTLALAGLGLSSGLAETMPDALHAEAGTPLRPGQWMRGCVSTLEFEDSPCPTVRRYRIVGDRDRDVELAWELIPGRCEVVVQDGERRRVFDDDAGWVALHVDEGRDIVVALESRMVDSCWYRLRIRPPKDRS